MLTFVCDTQMRIMKNDTSGQQNFCDSNATIYKAVDKILENPTCVHLAYKKAETLNLPVPWWIIQDKGYKIKPATPAPLYRYLS